MVESIYTGWTKKVHPYFEAIRKFRSTKRFLKSALYKEIKPFLEKVLEVCEMGNGGGGRESICHSRVSGNPVDPRFRGDDIVRAVSWNIERGMQFEGIVHILKEHPEIANADLYFLAETDIGMARSKNKNVAKELAKKLERNYVFAPCYVNLDKGNGPEVDLADGNNEVGLHGNAILSKWPLKNPRQIRLKNCKDKMRGKEKRIGSQSCVVADAQLPTGAVRAVCVHLDAHSSQKQRHDQMKTVLDFLAKENFKGPTLIGGDWNTSTYFASHAFFAFFSFWRKVAMGPKHVCKNHYPYPERYFERKLFRMIEKRGFDYKNFNALGVPTMHYHLGDETKNKNMRDWTPKMFQVFVDWAMKKAEGLAQFKIDWFAASGLKPVENSQKVVGHLNHQGSPVSDHDAIRVDFVVA